MDVKMLAFVALLAFVLGAYVFHDRTVDVESPFPGVHTHVNE